MSYGVFRTRTTPPLRRKFIPSKTAAVDASLLLKKSVDLVDFDEQYNSELYVRKKFIPARSTSLVTKQEVYSNKFTYTYDPIFYIGRNKYKPFVKAKSFSLVRKSKLNLRNFDEHYNHDLHLKSKFIATDRTASLLFGKIHGIRYKLDIDYGLYSDNKRFIPSVTAVVSDVSLIYAKKKNLIQSQERILISPRRFVFALSTSLITKQKKSFFQYEYRHDNEFYKMGSFVLSSLSVVAASLLFKNKKPIIKDEKYRSYKKPNFIFLTSSSLVDKKRVLPIIEPVNYSIFGVNKKHISSVSGQSLLYAPPKRLELFILNAIEEYKYYHYKRKEDYRIIGTVTPPPSDGSLIYKPRITRFDFVAYYPKRQMIVRFNRYVTIDGVYYDVNIIHAITKEPIINKILFEPINTDID